MDFHHALIEMIREALMPAVLPRYDVRVEERVYVEYHTNGRVDVVRPDMTMIETHPIQTTGSGRAAAAAVEDDPITMTLPMPERVREAFLTVRDRDSNVDVVTVLEVLSPGNKRAGSDGRREYLMKRDAVLQSLTHLIELDLLRGGDRLPMVGPLPAADYYALVCRGDQRPRAHVYAWTIRKPIPSIPVPLRPGDPDVMLDLQKVFHHVYDRAGYDYVLDHVAQVIPLLNESDTEWLETILRA